MWIYLIQKYSFEFAGIHSAYSSEEQAKEMVAKLNKEEEEKNHLYCEWVDNEGDEESMPLDFGDYTFSYSKVWLKGVVKQWLITTTDSEELSKQTNIIYKSKYTNLLGVETELSKEQLLNIEGVLNVEEAATGRFNKNLSFDRRRF